MIIDGSKLASDTEVTVDVAIIGSGAAGAVLAKELAEGGMNVAVVEEGGYHPTTSHKDLPWESIHRMYRDKGFTATIGRPNIVVPLGRVLGGTTTVNSGTCFRTPPSVLETWRSRFGLSEMTEENFAPIFDRIEKIIDVEETDFAVMSKANLVFHRALEKQGFTGAPLRRNAKECEGCGFCCYGCPSGAKRSMEVSYLPLAFKKGARAYTNARVEKLLKAGKRVIGLEASLLKPNGAPSGHRLKVNAARTIVAAGTILSPSLLKKNGIGRWNRNVGRHLTLHPATKVFARFEEDIKGWEGVPQAYVSDALKDQGVTFEGIFVPPDIAAMTVPFVGKRLHDFMHDYGKMAAFGFLISDSGSGRVFDFPFFGTVIRYDLTRDDVEKFRKGILFVARSFLAAGAKAVYTLLHGFSEITSEADLKRLEAAPIHADEIDGMAFHPLGTCRMATTAKKGVVDPSNRVFGWEGLYVCDGSVVPSPLGVNPQVTIMAFATRLAGLILTDKA